MGNKRTNNATATLAAGIGTVDTTISLTAGHGARFPTVGASDYFYGTLIDGSNQLEIVKVTARSTDTLTVVRAQDGFTAKVYSAGDKFELRPCNVLLEAMDQESLAVTAASGTDTYTGTMSPVPNGLNTDQIYPVKFANANTSTTPTLNLNSYGAKTIKGPGGRALNAGELRAGFVGLLQYDGTDFILLNPPPDFVESRIGTVTFWPGVLPIPDVSFECDGAAYSRTTYANLFAKSVKSATATITIASPAVVTWTAHGLKNHFPVKFTTTGTLPTGLIAGRTYWTKNVAANTFELALVPGAASINTSGTQSGTHTAICAPFGDGDGSTTFNVPNYLDSTLIGYGAATTAESFAAADVTTGTDAIAIQDNVVKWVTGMAVVLSTSGTAPTGLTAGNTYYVIRTGDGQIKLASSLALAQNGTAIDITGQGTGTHTITHTRPVRGLGESGGEDAHAMSITELLLHTHTQDAHAHQERAQDGVGGAVIGLRIGQNPDVTDPKSLGADVQTDKTDQGVLNTANATATNQNTGGNAAMNITQPFAAGRWVIYHS